MSLECPRCQSTRIGSNNYGKKTAGVVGAGAGAVGVSVPPQQVLRMAVP